MGFNLEQSFAVLERTPRVLETLLTGLGPEWTRPNEGPDTWSPFEVVGHLISGEETDWMARTRIILSDGSDRRFEPFNRFRHVGAHEERSLTELLARFVELRAGNLSELRQLALTPADLARTGEHPEFGTVTLAQLLSTWVVHDLGHIGQIVRVMAKQYKDAVGPWVAYLSVLTR
jgi:hypothetical protein